MLKKIKDLFKKKNTYEVFDEIDMMEKANFCFENGKIKEGYHIYEEIIKNSYDNNTILLGLLKLKEYAQNDQDKIGILHKLRYIYYQSNHFLYIQTTFSIIDILKKDKLKYKNEIYELYTDIRNCSKSSNHFNHYMKSTISLARMEIKEENYDKASMYYQDICYISQFLTIHDACSLHYILCMLLNDDMKNLIRYIEYRKRHNHSILLNATFIEYYENIVHAFGTHDTELFDKIISDIYCFYKQKNVDKILLSAVRKTITMLSEKNNM